MSGPRQTFVEATAGLCCSQQATLPGGRWWQQRSADLGFSSQGFIYIVYSNEKVAAE